jgi:HSP20 family protein
MPHDKWPYETGAGVETGDYWNLLDWQRRFGVPRRAKGAEREVWTPAFTSREDEESFWLSIDLPGIRPADVELNLENGLLTLRANRPLESSRESYARIERLHGAFSWSFHVPLEVDSDRIAAQLHDGILRIKLPKRARPENRSTLADPARHTDQKSLPKDVNADANYEAFRRDASELIEKFSGYIVAYADGKRIGEGRNAQELAARLPEVYRKSGLFITDVPSQPMKFRRPFRVLER